MQTSKTMKIVFANRSAEMEITIFKHEANKMAVIVAEDFSRKFFNNQPWLAPEKYFVVPYSENDTELNMDLNIIGFALSIEDICYICTNFKAVGSKLSKAAFLQPTTDSVH